MLYLSYEIVRISAVLTAIVTIVMYLRVRTELRRRAID
jgi:hypothetical protein